MADQKNTIESGIARDETVTPQSSLPASNDNPHGIPLKDASLPPLVISEKMRKHYFNGMGRRLIATSNRQPWAHEGLNFDVANSDRDPSLPIKHVYIIGNHALFMDDIYDTHIWPAVKEILGRTKLNCASVNVNSILTDFEGKRTRVPTVMITAEWSEENLERGQEVVDEVKRALVEHGVGGVECEIMEGCVVYL